MFESYEWPDACSFQSEVRLFITWVKGLFSHRSLNP